MMKKNYAWNKKIKWVCGLVFSLVFTIRIDLSILIQGLENISKPSIEYNFRKTEYEEIIIGDSQWKQMKNVITEHNFKIN